MRKALIDCNTASIKDALYSIKNAQFTAICKNTVICVNYNKTFFFIKE